MPDPENSGPITGPSMSTEELLEGVASATRPGALLWTVDDSEVEIDGITHTILGAISFHRPMHAVSGMMTLRQRLGVSRAFEFKWNSKISDPMDRHAVSESFLRILGRSNGLVTIIEGRDKQRGAELLLQQMVEFQEPRIIACVTFDENIVNERALHEFLISRDDHVRYTQFSVAQSRFNDLLQCADLFTGFQNLSVKLAIGTATDRTILSEDGSNLALSSVLQFSLRQVLWGERPFARSFDWADDLAPIPPEFWLKHARGLGLRIYSSIPEATQKILYDGMGVFYMGCLS